MEDHDRTPTFIFDTSFGTSVLGIPVSDIYKNGFDAELSARSISASRRFLGYDGMTGSTSCGDTRVFGADVELFPNRPPMVRRPAFKDPDDLYSHTPEEIDSTTIDGVVRSHIILRDLEPDAFISGYTPTPFLFCAVLRGIEHFLMDAFSGNGYFEELLNFSQKTSDIITEKVCSTGVCDAMLLPGAYDNVDLVGIDVMERFCIPGLKSIYSKIKRYDLPVIFHPHGVLTEGNGEIMLDQFIDIGFDCIYYAEDNDHRRIGELTKDRCSVMGGIDTATTIYLGPDERVVKDVENILDDDSNSDFIFTCSCSVDAGLDRDRLKLMIDTVGKRSGGPGRD